MQRKSAVDLAIQIHKLLRDKKVDVSQRLLEELCEVLFYASLRTEEGQSIRCQIVWIEPQKTDPNPLKLGRLDRWQYVPLANSLPFNEGTITKLALATDERTTALAVFSNADNNVVIHGLVDLGATYHRATTFDIPHPGPRPGRFYASITGPGRIIVGADTERLAELRVSEIIMNTDDVMMVGPIKDRLEVGRAEFIIYTKQIAAELGLEEDREREKALEEKWTRSLCRILHRIQGFGHGGALLITPHEGFPELSRNYQVTYSRLRLSLRHWASRFIQLEAARKAVDKQMNSQAGVQPALIRTERKNAARLAEAENEIDGVIWHIALLSRVDGLVLLTPDLTVHGFGVKIATNTSLERVWRARNRTASLVEALDFARLGMRHQSMMKYCTSHEGSIGFVVSHDGDVRTITQVEDRLVVWDKVRLTLDSYRNFVLKIRFGDNVMTSGSKATGED